VADEPASASQCWLESARASSLASWPRSASIEAIFAPQPFDGLAELRFDGVDRARVLGLERSDRLVDLLQRLSNARSAFSRARCSVSIWRRSSSVAARKLALAVDDSRSAPRLFERANLMLVMRRDVSQLARSHASVLVASRRSARVVSSVASISARPLAASSR
jgi:hypothetical protein